MSLMLSKLQIVNMLNNVKPEKSLINIEEVINKVKTIYLPEKIIKNISFECVIDQKQDFYSDSNLLRIIFETLIENCIYFKKNDDKSMIKLNIDISNNLFKMKIFDNGIGISKEKHEKIFEMFYRGIETSVGNGLGLFITKKAIEKLNGKITIDSEVNIFTEFTIQIPFNKDEYLNEEFINERFSA